MKKGVTTGTCAQAAAKGACLMLLRDKVVQEVQVKTASGVKLRLRLVEQQLGDNFAKCAVVKYSGDEPDVTNGAKIYAKVGISNRGGIFIRGGEGIGRVTKPGLAVRVGRRAINPMPRKMIKSELSGLLPNGRGLYVTISVPNGARLAENTFNPKVGIVGGISIIGTTGIVEPKSLDAYKASLALQLNMLKARGSKKAILVFGYVGERFCKDTLRLGRSAFIKIGDHVGFMLQESVKKKMKKVILIGHIGKMVKLVNGQFNTHNKFGDDRIGSITRYAKDCAASERVIRAISLSTTAEAAADILRKNKLICALEWIAKDAAAAAGKFIDNKLEVDCIILSLQGEVLAATEIA